MLQLNGTLRPEPRAGAGRRAWPSTRTTIRRVRAEVGLVFQDPDDQLFSPTVFDDVAFGPLHMGLPADEVHRRVERALAAVGMAGFAHRVPHRMSLGQRKRVAAGDRAVDGSRRSSCSTSRPPASTRAAGAS